MSTLRALGPLVMTTFVMSCHGASGLRTGGAVGASEGGLRKDQIQAVMQRAQGELAGCYEDALSDRPDLKGTVTVHLRVNHWGDVELAEVQESTLHSFSTEHCLVQKLQEVRFPEPAGGGTVDVTYPLQFAPGR